MRESLQVDRYEQAMTEKDKSAQYQLRKIPCLLDIEITSQTSAIHRLFFVGLIFFFTNGDGSLWTAFN